MPTLIHFFHMGHNRDKKNLMKNQGLWLIDDNLQCKKENPPGAVKFKVCNKYFLFLNNLKSVLSLN